MSQRPRRGSFRQRREAELRAIVLALLVTLNGCGTNDIVLEDSRVSRYQARLERRAGEVWIVDLHSTNGTQVNGSFVREARLHDGDTISLAGVKITFKEAAQ